MNNIDTSGKIKVTMYVANESVLEFLDLSLDKTEQNKFCVDVYVKLTNSFTYVLPSTCYPKRNITNIPKSVALRLGRICHSDEKFDTRRDEHPVTWLPEYRQHPKGMSLKFNTSICIDKVTDMLSRNISKIPYFSIRIIVQDAVSRKADNLKSKKVNAFRTVRTVKESNS